MLDAEFDMPINRISRRLFLKSSVILLPGWIQACGGGSQSSSAKLSYQVSNISNLGPLQEPDINGLKLPDGFTSRIVAVSGTCPCHSSGYPWHGSPDGGATFSTLDDGWIYVSNSEKPSGMGGVGAIKFDASGDISDTYSILSGTTRNCAGGPSPWGTWLSCEEIDDGIVYECDPLGGNPAIPRPALGVFKHEAVAIDLLTSNAYLTEDQPDGGFYRFTPSLFQDDHPDYSSGKLEIAEVETTSGGRVTWHEVPDPSGSITATRYQVPAASQFNGGEGIWYWNTSVLFATKGDNRIWTFALNENQIDILFDDDYSWNSGLFGVDNILVSEYGDVLVAEDGGDMQVVAVTADRRTVPIVQVIGHHPNSEITGPAFSPDMDRLYFSSQSGFGGTIEDGITFEISGPFTVPNSTKT